MSKTEKNAFEVEDLLQVVEEIEGFHAEEQASKERAKKHREKEVENAKARAKQLGIPNDILTSMLKERKLDRDTAAKRRKIIGSVKEDHIELYEESSGQLAMFKPDEKSKELTATQIELDRRRAEIKAREEAEQAEGEQVLDDLTGA